MDVSTAPLALPVATVRARFRPLADLRLPAYPGSAFRGAFGHAFRKTVCTQGPIPCKTCFLLARCPYPKVFESAPPADSERLSKNSDVPRPYVLRPLPDQAPEVPAGADLAFDLVLVGEAIELFPYFVLALKQAAAEGLTQRRVTLRLEAIEDPAPSVLLYDGSRDLILGPPSVFDPSALSARTAAMDPTRATVRFLTPTRIFRAGRMQDQPSFEDLVRAGLRRLSALAYFHGGRPVDLDWAALCAAAAQVRTTSAELRRAPWRRWSSRQGRAMDMDGVLGEAQYEARHEGDLAPFLPLLAMLERVHVGKGAVYGLGRVEVR